MGRTLLVVATRWRGVDTRVTVRPERRRCEPDVSVTQKGGCMESDDLDVLDEHDIHLAEFADDDESITLDLDSLWDISL